jgi:hypothetical protein
MNLVVETLEVVLVGTLVGEIRLAFQGILLVGEIIVEEGNHLAFREIHLQILVVEKIVEEGNHLAFREIHLQILVVEGNHLAFRGILQILVVEGNHLAFRGILVVEEEIRLAFQGILLVEDNHRNLVDHNRFVLGT